MIKQGCALDDLLCPQSVCLQQCYAATTKTRQQDDVSSYSA